MADTDPVTAAPAPPVLVTFPADAGSRTTASAAPALVTLPAGIDMANADMLGEQLAAALVPGVRVVIADMTATTFCDSAGARMLVLAWRRAVAGGTELRLLGSTRPCCGSWKSRGLMRCCRSTSALDEALTGAVSRS